MARPVTLFTGQWADLPLADLAARCGAWGFDGLELACWGDHFEVDRALADEAYCREQRSLLEQHGLDCWALGAHLVGPEVTELIQGFVVAMNLETTEEELFHTIFPHPTLSETMKEAVLDAYGRVLNM